MTNLTNINFMSQANFDTVTTTNDDELYAVEAAGFGFPSDNYINLSIAAETEYTAPANGYFCICKQSTVQHQYIYVKNNTIDFKVGEFATAYANQTISISVAARKGDKCVWGGTFDGTTWYLKFVYAEGEI